MKQVPAPANAPLSLKTERAARGPPVAQVSLANMDFRYPRTRGCPADCIMIAATLRHTAAAAANVKSEIHMTAIPSF